FEMLHHRLGDDLFFRLLRHLYVNYGFRILFVEQFQKELELITGEDWAPFFNDWLRTSKIADWKIGKVTVRAAENMAYETHAEVHQIREINEPVTVGIWTEHCDGPYKQIALLPDADSY